MSDFEERDAVGASKRLAMVWTPWMGDWFVSHSPRNGNSNGEGYWDHWVDLAIGILQHPATKIVRPEAHEATEGLETVGFYSEVRRELTEDELRELFGGEA